MGQLLELPSDKEGQTDQLGPCFLPRRDFTAAAKDGLGLMDTQPLCRSTDVRVLQLPEPQERREAFGLRSAACLSHAGSLAVWIPQGV